MARVVVDAEGGDHGLSVVLDGVCRLSMEDTTIQMLLVGDADAITEALETRRHNPARIQGGTQAALFPWQRTREQPWSLDPTARSWSP